MGVPYYLALTVHKPLPPVTVNFIQFSYAPSIHHTLINAKSHSISTMTFISIIKSTYYNPKSSNKLYVSPT